MFCWRFSQDGAVGRGKKELNKSYLKKGKKKERSCSVSSAISRGQERGAVPGVPPSRHTSKGPGAQRQSPEGRGWAPHPSPLGPPALSTRCPSPSPGCLHPAPIPARSFPTMSSPSAKSHPSSVSPAAAPAAGPGRRGQSSRQGGEEEQGQEAAGQPWLNAPGQGAQAAPLFRTLLQCVGGVRLPPGHPTHPSFPKDFILQGTRSVCVTNKVSFLPPQPPATSAGYTRGAPGAGRDPAAAPCTDPPIRAGRETPRGKQREKEIFTEQLY